MRYWYDCEFIDDGKTVDLISIGIVASDGREYYAINSDCNFSHASLWVQENVIAQLESNEQDGFTFWKTHNQIAIEVKEFLLFDPSPVIDGQLDEPFELWAYYAAYDHVALCQLWGAMMDLPEGMPMYTRDIKQECDRLGNPKLPEQGKGSHNALEDARWNKSAWEFLHEYEEDCIVERK